MKIVVIGGSGLDREKTRADPPQLGHDAVPASPSSGVNALTGEGLAEVLAGEMLSSTCRTRRPSRTPRCSRSSRRPPETCSPRKRPPGWGITSPCRSSGPTACRTAGTCGPRSRRSG